MKPSPYGPFPYSPVIHRPRLNWPGDAQVALWVIPNIEFFSLMEKVPAGSGGPGTPVPDIPSWSARDYGNRVGVFRLMRVLNRYGIRGTVALNSDLCAQHPEIIADGPSLGDLPILEAVHRSEVANVGAGLGRNPHEVAAGPISTSSTKLHDVITVGDHDELVPVLACHLVTAVGLQELTCAG